MAESEFDSAEDGKQGGIQVIARSSAIMRALGAHPHGLSLAAIAQKVDLPRSTVQRIVNALESELLVEAMGPNGGFRLGPALGQLIYLTQFDIISEVHPHLENLSGQFKETAALGCRAGVMINAIDRVIAERVLRIVIPIGASAPLCASALGKALLASMPDDVLDHVLSAPMQMLTPKTLSLPALKKELAQIRRDGFAIDVEEYEEGTSSAAVAIETYMGTFSIGLILPCSRFAGRADDFGQALLDAKKIIEARIGAKSHKAR
jgi:DNA-binding IclR family transcriptional regulator